MIKTTLTTICLSLASVLSTTGQSTHQTNKPMNNDFMEIISYAAKAPSGHNTQPWRFSLEENTISIKANFEVSLPVVDSNNREVIYQFRVCNGKFVDCRRDSNSALLCVCKYGE